MPAKKTKAPAPKAKAYIDTCPSSRQQAHTLVRHSRAPDGGIVVSDASVARIEAAQDRRVAKLARQAKGFRAA